MIKSYFFSVGLKEIDLLKFKIPSEDEYNGIVKGNRTWYKWRIKDRLSYKTYNFYDVTKLGGIPNSESFQCLHYFNS